MSVTFVRSRYVAPPSALPGISPARGEIMRAKVCDWLISPPAGEMSGRTEGGNVERTPDGSRP